MRKAHTTPVAAIFVILLLGSGEYGMVIEQYLARFDGVVVSRTDDVHYSFWTRNLATRYVLLERDGRKRIYYADPSQGHIDGFSIGTRLAKQRWHMDYTANGEARNDFPFPFYLFWMILDFGLLAGCIILALMIRIRDRQTRELEIAVERGEELLREGDRGP